MYNDHNDADLAFLNQNFFLSQPTNYLRISIVRILYKTQNNVMIRQSLANNTQVNVTMLLPDTKQRGHKTKLHTPSSVLDCLHNYLENILHTHQLM